MPSASSSLNSLVAASGITAQSIKKTLTGTIAEVFITSNGHARYTVDPNLNILDLTYREWITITGCTSDNNGYFRVAGVDYENNYIYLSNPKAVNWAGIGTFTWDYIIRALHVAVGQGGGGITPVAERFRELLDTPNAYTGYNNYSVVVNSSATGLAFVLNTSTDEHLKVSAADTAAGYLEDKIDAGIGVNSTNALQRIKNNVGADESLAFIFDETKVNHDNLLNYLENEHFTMLDEDDMSSNSDTQAATQQSIKAYVDSAEKTADDVTIEEAANVFSLKNIDYIIGENGASMDGSSTAMSDANKEVTNRAYIDENTGRVATKLITITQQVTNKVFDMTTDTSPDYTFTSEVDGKWNTGELFVGRSNKNFVNSKNISVKLNNKVLDKTGSGAYSVTWGTANTFTVNGILDIGDTLLVTGYDKNIV